MESGALPSDAHREDKLKAPREKKRDNPVGTSPNEVLKSASRLSNGKEDDRASKKQKKTTITDVNGALGGAARRQQQQPNEHQRPQGRPSQAAVSDSSSVRSSPFRIRVGCVVALRSHRAECPSLEVVSTSTTTGEKERVRLFPPLGGAGAGSWIRVWTDPIPGRDEGLNLIGKRVRMQVPMLTPTQEKSVLEGEIIRLLDYVPSSATHRLPKPHKPLRVELLIDSRQLQNFPFLKRVEYYDAPSSGGATSLSGGVGASSAATSGMLRRHRQQQRQQEFEARIRGHGTDVVTVKLAPAHSVLAFGKSTSSRYFGSPVRASKGERGAPPSNNDDSYKENASRASSAGLSWAILRLVPAKLWGEFRRSPATSGQPRARSGDDEAKEAIEGDPRAYGERREPIIMKSTKDNQRGSGAIEASAKVCLDGAGRNKTLDRVDQSSSAPRAEANASKRTRKGSTASSIVVQGVRHMGDGADTPDRQVQNWRWFAARFCDMLLRSPGPRSTAQTLLGGSATFSPSILPPIEGVLSQILSGGLLGEVTQIERADADGFRDSLARVTIRRLLLPEHTRSGRLPIHDCCDVFEDADGIRTILDNYEVSTASDCLEIPIEHLVIVGRKVHRWDQVSTVEAALLPPPSLDLLHVSHTYSLRDDEYRRLCPRIASDRLLDPSGYPQASTPSSEDSLMLAMNLQDRSIDSISRALFAKAQAAAESLTSSVNFDLPSDFLGEATLPKPQVQAIIRAKKVILKANRSHKASGKDKAVPSRTVGREAIASSTCIDPPEDQPPFHSAQLMREVETTAKETCSRVLVYDCSQKRRNVTAELVSDRPRNMREFIRQQKRHESHSTGSSPKADDKSNSRANRASQRRFMKDAAANSSWFMGVDTLASREPKLRFDRSGIHSWGVYADVNIAAGEMIVEYRGELIGIAVTEKREAEYAEAKIGSDYMFRIDNLLFCDATKQGNVARFINASCDPNCFTKIITLDGTKRIVIYAKRDIRAGEELCYDYKFPLEYDETKRIPCHCGAKDCRGFMNWVRT
jgi:SET domain